MNSSSQSSFYVVTRLLLFTVIGSTLLSACGPSGPPPDPRQVKLENEIRNLEATKRKLQHDAKAFQAIERAQKANKPVVTATFAGRDLEKALDRAMPITFPAKQLSSYVSGTVRVLGIKNVKLDGNKGRFQLVAKGKNIKINTAIPLGYQTMAKELIASLKSGVTINVKGEVFLDDKGRAMFKGRCDKVKLKKYNKKKYQDMVRGGVNKSILSRSHPLNVEAARVGNQKLPLRLVTKGRKKLLFVYAK